MGNCCTKKLNSSPKSNNSRKSTLIFDKKNNSEKTPTPKNKEKNLSDAFIFPDSRAVSILPIHKSSRDITSITKHLASHSMFKHFPSSIIQQLSNVAKLFRIQDKTIIFSEGSSGTHFFIVKKGEIEVSAGSMFLEVLSNHNTFGEEQLIKEARINSTYRCLGSVELWGILKSDFISIASSENISKIMNDKKFILASPLFKALKTQEFDTLKKLIFYQTFNQFNTIITEGRWGNLVYLIKSGSVSCYSKGKKIRELRKNEIFGEDGFVYNRKHSLTVVALETVEVICVFSDDLRGLINENRDLVLFKNSLRTAFENSLVLQKLTKTQLETIIDSMQLKEFTEGEIFIQSNSCKTENLWVVLKGELHGFNPPQDHYCIGDKYIFSDIDKTFKKDIKAKNKVKTAIISKEKLISIVGDDYQKAVSKNVLLKTLQDIPLFKALSPETTESILNSFHLKSFKKNEIVSSVENPKPVFYIISSGKFQLKNKENHTNLILETGGYFGHTELVLNRPRPEKITSLTESSLWALRKKDFQKLVGNNALSKLDTVQFLNTSIELSDLKLISIIDKGQFGSVFLCTDCNNTKYALKTVCRSTVFHFDLSENLASESKIMKTLDHPMVVKLVKTFKDELRVYFLMEYINGKDLFMLLQKCDYLKESEGLFIASCTVLVLEYLHSLSVVYRDVKPENVIIDADGYPKLIDFGVSKIIHGRTNTVIGTPHYMAPEVIRGQGYSFQADFWSLGVYIYEILYGNVPFAAKESCPKKIYEAILEKKVTFPNYNYVPAAKNLVMKLLSLNPAARGSIESIKKDGWFRNIPWEDLMKKNIRPPEIFFKNERDVGCGDEDLHEYIRVYEAKNFCDHNEIISCNWDFEF